MKKSSKNNKSINNTNLKNNYTENTNKTLNNPNSNEYLSKNNQNLTQKPTQINPTFSSKNQPSNKCINSINNSYNLDNYINTNTVNSNKDIDNSFINDNSSSNTDINANSKINVITTVKPNSNVNSNSLKNLVPTITDSETARQLGRLGAAKSTEVKKKKKSLQELFKIIGQMPLSEKDSAMAVLEPHKEKFEALGIELTQDVALTFCNQAVAQTNPQMAKLVYQMRQELPAEKAVIATTELELTDDRLLNFMRINEFDDEE